MRTTLNLDPAVLNELRARGAREQRSLGAVASDLLAAALKEADPEVPAVEWTWIAQDLGQPKVDLTDREAVRRALEAR